jgi:hypothetical protein
VPAIGLVTAISLLGLLAAVLGRRPGRHAGNRATREDDRYLVSEGAA